MSAKISFSFGPVTQDDFEDLLELRIVTMREHLERLGRFHPDRAHERFQSGFNPAQMRKILVNGEMAGVVSLQPNGNDLELLHFYLYPTWQSKGLGAQVLYQLVEEAQNKDIILGVLKGSPARRFYERHGFELTHSEEWDDYLRRKNH